MRRSLRLTSLLLLWLTTAVAYGQTVTGRVTSASDGSAMPGVSILLKGSTTGTATDTEGRFTLSVPDVSSATLTISFIGYATQDVALAGRTSVDVVLSEDISQLGEVVVTALGVQREAKTLVYGTQAVKASQLTEVRDANNVLNSLQGKIANTQITQGSGGPGSGARIVMRGNRSIQGSNNALIVVDGVPITNVSADPAQNDFGSIQNSDGASSLNPDDIESVNVLRGASAAALYGSQAGNGVIVITTKKGSRERVSVNINSGITAERPFALPRLQNTYGQGLNGDIDASTSASWGAPMQGQSYTNHLGKESSYSPQEDNIKDFFRTGISLNNSIGVQGGSEKMQTYVSYTNNHVEGIVPNNDMTKHIGNLRISNQITSKLSTDAKVTYLYHDIKGRPRTGEENAPVIDIYQIPRSMNLDDAKVIDATKDNIPVAAAWPTWGTGIYQNPYWMTDRTSIDETRNRITGFFSAKYEFSPKAILTGRANLDKILDVGTQKYNNDTKLWANPGGSYQVQNTDVTQQWYDLILSGAFTLSPDFSLNYLAGTIFQDTKFDQATTKALGLNYANLFALQNAESRETTTKYYQYRTESVFGQLSVGYKEAIFLEATLRNDWDSRLPSPYTILYPSVGASAVLSELVTMPNAISFLKLNANYAVVGNGGQHQIRTEVYEFKPGAGKGLVSRTKTQAIPGLKPEMVHSVEFGVDSKFFEGRLGVAVNYYRSVSKNQLLKIAQPVATGYTDRYINTGEIQNKGIEAVITGIPVRTENLTWDVTFNLGINRNKTLELLPSNPTLQTPLGGSTGFSRTATPIVESGGSYGDMWGLKWMRDAQGRFMVNDAGLPMATTENHYLGNFNPKATLGLTNSVSFKNFSARLLIDGRVGGIIIDGTEMNMAFSGTPEVTEKFRAGGLNLGGVGMDGEPVDAEVTAQQFWTAGNNSTTGQRYGVAEFFTYSATNFRIRELSIGYNIPVPQGFFIKSAKFSLVARNLAWLYRGESILDIPGIGKRKLQIDPDMSLGNGNFQGVQVGALPSTRSLGCNLNLTF
jgi:TonB-linked SusC/RagA family outer membrane protein